MLKAVVFDLDDTLYDEKQFVTGGFYAVSHQISMKYDIDQKLFFKLLLEIQEKYGRGHTFDIAIEKLDISEKKNKIPQLVEIYRNHTPCLLPFPETLSVLSKLKKRGYKLGLITDGDANVQKNKVKALNIDELFDSMIFSNEFGNEKQKPHPFPYQKIIEFLNVRSAEMIYVGDNPYKDFITAKKLGINTVRILKGSYKDITLNREYEAKYRIRNINELLDLIPYIGQNLTNKKHLAV